MRAAVVAIAVAITGCQDGSRPARRDDAARRPTTWSVRLTDGAGGPPIAARVLLIDAASQPVRIGVLDHDHQQSRLACPIAPGVIGTWDGLLFATGIGEVPIGADGCAPSPAIPHGLYTVWAWRGPEHERWESEVDLREGRGRVETVIPLERVARPGGVVADLHVHGAASNDSLVPNEVRAVAQAAVGVQIVALSDHNAAGDLGEAIAAAGLGGVLASIASVELSGEIHLGVYPLRLPLDVTAAVDAKIDPLFGFAGRVPGGPVIQLNHPRLRWSALYDKRGWDGTAWPPPFALAFDAVEVLSGDTTFNGTDDRRLDQSITDFYTLIDHGFLVTAVGNSDTHHLTGIRDAVTRNYIAVEATPWPIDEREVIDAIRHRELWTTSGPLLEVTARGDGPAAPAVGPGGAIHARATVTVAITLRQARWVVTDTVRVRVGGARGPELVKELAVPRGARETAWTVAVAVDGVDTWIGVDAIGDTPLPVEITGTYLAEDGRPGTAPAALINPILVDANADGWWQRGDGRVRLDGARAVGGRASLRHVVSPSR